MSTVIEGVAEVSAAGESAAAATIESVEAAMTLAAPIDGEPVVREHPSRPSAKSVIAHIFPDGEPQRGWRGHALLSQELVEQFPGLYETEGTSLSDKVIYAQYFTTSADWHIVELDRETGEMFGRWDLGFRPTTASELGLRKEAA